MNLEAAIQQRRFRSIYHKLALNLIYTGNWFNRENQQWLKAHGLTVPQYNILRILRGQHPEPVRVQTIQERMLDPMSNVSRLVEKLLHKGLADRTPCPDDRRAVHVSITPQGLDLLDRLDIEEARLIRLLGGLDEGDATTLNTLLDQLRTEASPRNAGQVV